MRIDSESMASNIKRTDYTDPGGTKTQLDSADLDHPIGEKSLIVHTKPTQARKTGKHEYSYYSNQENGLTIQKITGAQNPATKIQNIIERKKSQFILIEGAAGTGKSTCPRQLLDTYKWKKHFQNFTQILEFTVLEDDPMFQANEVPELIEALQMSGSQSECLQEVFTTTGGSCMVLIDVCGDLVDRAESKRSSVLMSIISRKLLPEATLVVFCRPACSDYLNTVGRIDAKYSLKGFKDDGSAIHFIKSNSRNSKQLLSYLDQNELKKICSNPRICKVLVKMSKTRSYSASSTLTDFLYQLIVTLFLELMTSEEKEACYIKGKLSFEKLPERIESAFDVICNLAMQHLLIGHHNKSKEESGQFLSSFSLKLSKVSLEKSYLFGLVDCSLSTDSLHAYEFICPVVMEFLAAFHLYKQKPPLDQLLFFYTHALELFSNGFTHWLRFFHGLVGADHMTSETTMYNPTKLMINTVNDLLTDCLKLTFEPQHRVAMVTCLLEAREKSIVRKLATKSPVIFDASFPIGQFDGICVEMINSSGLPDWIITAGKDHVASLAEKVKTKCSAAKIEIKADESSADHVTITPKSKPPDFEIFNEREKFNSQTKEDKIQKLNHFCCRACREILQRILPLYSKVKIKADSTNVSYVSFLTCACFEKSFLENVRMFPTQSIHFLKGKKRVDLASDLNKLNPTERHNLTTHDGYAMEVVLMLRPQLRRIECVIPDSNQEFSIILSSGDVPLSAETVSEFTREKSIFVVGSIHHDSYCENSSERVLPPLPVVQKTSRSQTQAPKPFIPPQEQPYLPQITEEPSKETSPSPDSPLALHQAEGIPLSSRESDSALQPRFLGAPPLQRPEFQGGQFPVIESNVNVSSMNLTPLKRSPRLSAAQARPESSIQPSPGVYVQPVEAVQPQSKRQEAMRAGTVLFSSIPSKIPYDQIQPLPDQSVLIRKGGNGSIYSVTIKGTPMAVKKTSYRSKEYAIITKVRHKNVVPLLAFLWGEEHEVNRRRYYVYHFLPKMSGDLARLLTDKEELSLSEYYRTHKTDPLTMGLAVGNVKYTLKQILEGIQYLHDMHIAHRDLKASNVLIKFYCGCDNILHCGCDQKYQVLLCDFDAAIELDSSDRLTPTHSSRSPTSSQHVEVVPVGTNGFRSPESSSLIIASSVEALDPQISTKTDIYSFGMLSLRLMLCTGTPYSQRAMSTLLLHYYQNRDLPEGRLRGRLRTGMVVDETAVHKILKLTKLEPRMRWAPGACDFVSSCVSVDPEARPSATELLTHQFLN